MQERMGGGGVQGTLLCTRSFLRPLFPSAYYAGYQLFNCLIVVCLLTQVLIWKDHFLILT